MNPRVIEVLGWHSGIPGRRPAGDALEWQDAARCAEVDPEIFFPERGGSVRDAKRVCQGCEVRAACLQYAVSNGIAFGIWGGMSERQRRSLGPQHLDLPAPRATGLAA